MARLLKVNYGLCGSLDRDICHKCIKHAEQEPEHKSEKFRHYILTVVTFEFKLDLTFYIVPTNKNKKISKEVSRHFILEPVVK